MNKYLVTYRWQEDTNGELSVKLRSRLERASSNNQWVHIFENQLALKSDLSLSELYDLLLPEAKNLRISIVKYDDLFVNDFVHQDLFEKYGLI